MIELNDYVEDATKCVFIYEPENYEEGKGYGLTILCGISGNKSIVSNDGEPVFLRDEKTTRLAVSKMNKQTSNLINLLIANKRLSILYDIAHGFNDIYNREICISPLKSLSVHFTNINSSYGLSPFIDYKKLWDENK